MSLNYTKVISEGAALITEMLIGFFAVKFKILKAETIPGINKFAFKGCFAFLSFRLLMKTKITELDFIPFCVNAIGSVFTQIFLCILLLFPFKKKFEEYISIMAPTCMINYVIIGLPIYLSLWDPSNQVIVSIITLSNDLITTPVFLVLTGFWAIQQRNIVHQQKGEPLEKASWHLILNVLKNFVSNPMLIGDVVGFIVSGIGRGVPDYIDRIANILADCVLALSMICVGGFLASHSIISCKWWEFVICLVVRFFIFPFFTLLAALMFKLEASKARICVIMATLPTASAAYMMAQTVGIATGTASTMIFWSLILSVPVVILWFAILDGLNLFVE